MITKSFILLDKIGPETERRLWEQGIKDWNSFLSNNVIEGISPLRKGHYDRKLREAKNALYSLDSAHFVPLIPQAETWRLYDFFREEAVFLDIETSGMSMDHDITVVGLYDGQNTKSMIRGVNLNYQALKEELSRYKLIVTFNGASFDLPFIRKRYPGLLPFVPHMDLRTVTGRLGYSGGLKAIEKEFGVERRELVNGLSGGDAVTLWRMYRGSGDEHYLNLLVEYNEEDVINLKKIADSCCKRMENEICLASVSSPAMFEKRTQSEKTCSL
jgi:uncharacterized protein